MSFLRKHFVTLATLTVGVILLAVFTWADWHNYVQDQMAHKETAVFWSTDYLANWLDQAAQNWHSEVLFGIWLAYQINRGQSGEEQS